MRLKSLLLAVVILIGVSSCAQRINCPTYSDQELHKEIKINSDREA